MQWLKISKQYADALQTIESNLKPFELGFEQNQENVCESGAATRGQNDVQQCSVGK